MADKGKEFVKKIFGEMFHRLEDNDNTIIKTNTKSKLPYLNDKLQQQVNNEEAIVANKIKLKTMKSITDSMIDEAFNEANLDEFIKTLIQIKVAEKVKSQAYYIVEEALGDLEDDYSLTNKIKTSVINKIKNIF